MTKEEKVLHEVLGKLLASSSVRVLKLLRDITVAIFVYESSPLESSTPDTPTTRRKGSSVRRKTQTTTRETSTRNVKDAMESSEGVSPVSTQDT